MKRTSIEVALAVAAFFALLALAAGVLSALGCHSHQTPHRHNAAHITVPVDHLKNGNYAYQGDDGFWYYYILLHTVVNPPSSSASPSASAISGRLPAGGTWTKSDKAPDEEEIAQEEEVEFSDGEQGLPDAAVDEPGDNGDQATSDSGTSDFGTTDGGGPGDGGGIDGGGGE